MMKNNVTFLNLILAFLVIIALHNFCAFDFMYKEQNSIFRFSSEYAVSYFNHPGGAIEYLANFIRQFYYYPWVGSIVTGILFWLTTTGVGILTKSRLPLFSITVGLLIAVLEVNEDYMMECSLALILCIWCTNAVLWLYNRSNPIITSILAFCLLVLLFYLLGFGYGENANFSHIWTLSRYSNTFQETTKEAYYPWGIVVLAVLFSRLPFMRKCENWLSKAKKNVFIFYIPQIILSIVCCGLFYYKQYDANTAALKRLEVRRWHNQWNSIIAEPLPTWDFPVLVCYKTLALAKRGELSKYLMEFPHAGSNHLWIPYNGARYEADLLSDIYMAQGNVAMAQEMAFNAMGYYKNNINARLLLRLIETNLIYGADDVALKYIRLLEDTWVYGEKANQYRTFIGHPERLKEDAYLNELHDCLTLSERLTKDDLEDMKGIMAANSSFVGARDYYGCFLLLCNMKEEFLKFVDEYCYESQEDDTRILIPAYAQGLPKVFQEALILFVPQTDWKKVGISTEVQQQYATFQKALDTVGGDLRQLPRECMKTYWFYSLRYAQKS